MKHLGVREEIIARIQAAGYDMFFACDEADRLIKEVKASPGTTIKTGIMGSAGKCADVIALRYEPKADGKTPEGKR